MHEDPPHTYRVSERGTGICQVQGVGGTLAAPVRAKAQGCDTFLMRILEDSCCKRTQKEPHSPVRMGDEKEKGTLFWESQLI